MHATSEVKIRTGSWREFLFFSFLEDELTIDSEMIAEKVNEDSQTSTCCI